MASGGSLAAKPWKHVHRKLSQPTVHSPDMIESPSSQCGRRTMEGRSSPARSTAPELNDGEGVAFLVQEVAPKLKEAPGPTQREWERVSGLVHSEWQQIEGVTGGRLTGVDKRRWWRTLCMEGGHFYRGEHRDRRDGSGWRLALGRARTTRARTRRRRHAARQTGARDLPGDDAERVLSIHNCPNHTGKGGRNGVHAAREGAPAHRT
jgi:hypothetical protein